MRYTYTHTHTHTHTKRNAFEFHGNYSRCMKYNNTWIKKSFQLQKTIFFQSHHHWLYIFASDEQKLAYHAYKRVAPKVMPPISLCCPTMWSWWYGSRIETFLPITWIVYFLSFVRDSSWVVVWQIDIWHKNIGASLNSAIREKLNSLTFINTQRTFMETKHWM